MKAVHIHHGDSREVIKGLADNSIDSVVCDPPYALVSIVKRFGGKNAAPAKSEGASGVYKRASAGFMGQAWDTGETAFDPEFWAEVLRVLKPGGHLIAASGTRTYHRLAVAIEDAGFEVRDMISWLYGSGFPKGLNTVNKLIELALCQYPEHAQIAVQASRSIQARSSAAKEPIAVALAQILPEGGLALITEIGGAVALHEATDTWPSSWMENIGLSTPFSWSGSLDAACKEASRCITETISETTIDPKTLNWLIGLHTSANTTLCSATLRNGSRWPAVVAARCSTAGAESKSDTLIVTALGSATWNPVARFDGFNIALKPACEPWVLARKPLDGTVAANVLAHGTGALNIDGCRIHGEDAHGGTYTVKRLKPGATLDKTGGNWRPEEGGVEYHGEMKPGRWPSNVIHDGSDEVVDAFPDAPGQQAALSTKPGQKTRGIYGKMSREGEASAGRRYTDEGATNFAALPGQRRGDEGSAARFFYSAKADADDRLGSKHPTVKPIDLMRYLVRLVTPPGGVVLDPFAGSGSTGVAAMLEGFESILIEREADYVEDIKRKVAFYSGEGRLAAQEKGKVKAEPVEDLPLFGGEAA